MQRFRKLSEIRGNDHGAWSTGEMAIVFLILLVLGLLITGALRTQSPPAKPSPSHSMATSNYTGSFG